MGTMRPTAVVRGGSARHLSVPLSHEYAPSFCSLRSRPISTASSSSEKAPPYRLWIWILRRQSPTCSSQRATRRDLDRNHPTHNKFKPRGGDRVSQLSLKNRQEHPL